MQGRPGSGGGRRPRGGEVFGDADVGSEEADVGAVRVILGARALAWSLTGVASGGVETRRVRSVAVRVEGQEDEVVVDFALRGVSVAPLGGKVNSLAGPALG